MTIFDNTNYSHLNMKAISLLPLICVACAAPSATDDNMLQGTLTAETQQVTTAIASTQPFFDEIISNGIAEASRYSDVYWQTSGTISELRISNGSRVQAGDTLARIDDFRLRNALEAAKAALESARLQMHEAIIGQGYNPDSANNIPARIIELAQIKSGYLQAAAAYKRAEHDASQACIVAPISGIVANLNATAHNIADTHTPACRITDTKALRAAFAITENELRNVAVGDKVEILPTALPEQPIQGIIAEINPYVDINGMISAKASISAASNIYEGMHLTIKIRKYDGDYISVPKSAIVMRSNRAVVFTAEGGKAKWKYVTTHIENSELIAIKDGLAEGDTIITSGNTFLAHNTDIVLSK